MLHYMIAYMCVFMCLCMYLSFLHSMDVCARVCVCACVCALAYKFILPNVYFAKHKDWLVSDNDYVRHSFLVPCLQHNLKRKFKLLVPRHVPLGF